MVRGRGSREKAGFTFPGIINESKVVVFSFPLKFCEQEKIRSGQLEKRSADLHLSIYFSSLRASLG
jgi:hypothetical protein